MATEELKLDVKDFNRMSEIHDDDRFMMTQASNAHFAASMNFGVFKEKVLTPIIESSKPNSMGCEIFASIDEYNALPELDPKTMYVIIDGGKITHVFLGEYPFSIGGGEDTSGIPIEQVFLNLYDLVLELGETKQLTSTYEPLDATNTVLSWSTSNRLIASVSNGLVTSVGKGECLIKVKARSGAYAECMITVEVTLLGLSFSSENNKLVSGFTTQLEPIAVPQNATLDLTYTSSDSSKAIVDPKTGEVTPVVSTGNVTISAVNRNGVRASIVMGIVPFAVSVSCQGIDNSDDSVSNIFSKWQLSKKGNPTHYKYSETINENGIESTLQSVDWTPFPDNSIVDIELYAEFGYKYINWSFKNDSHQEDIVVPVFYKEPELITYNFDIDVQCTQEEAQAMYMEIPYYKYNKKFTYCLRNDDNLQSLWRNGFRYVNREWNGRVRKFVPHTDEQVRNLEADEKLKAPRRLGYTNGCGVLIPFSFDVAGMVQGDNHIRYWDNSNTINSVKIADIEKARDYGGHFILHNMAFYEDDPVKPKYENDYSYPLQRDRQIIYDTFGYTSVSYANPDGDWWYTRACIKDPKTLLFSGNSTSLSVDPDGVYGKPAHRLAFGWNSDLSNVPLSEIRNTLLVYYMYHDNAPYLGNLWATQYQYALAGKPTLAVELTHGLDHEDPNGGNPGKLRRNLQFFDEIYDTVGAIGSDYIWICSQDEVIEYMYYQRAAKVTKTLTDTGCKFNIKIDIPNYLSYKTYSAIIKNLPETAIVTRGAGVTSFSKNIKTGLINFGYSLDTVERAARYVQKYLSDRTKDNLDLAWYFTRLLGELQTPYSSQLPELNEKPVIGSVSLPETLVTNETDVTTVNSNKEFGEADCLEISDQEDFQKLLGKYKINWLGGHKYYDPIDSSSKEDTFHVSVPFLFNSLQTLYFRLRNFNGVSNVISKNTTIVRTPGVNDPTVTITPDTQFKKDDSVEYKVEYANVSEFRYKLDSAEWTEWFSEIPESGIIEIQMTKGERTVTFQGRNNLSEIDTDSNTINFTGKQRVILFANRNLAGLVEGVGFVNKARFDGANPTNIYDLEGNFIGKDIGKYYNNNRTVIDQFRAKYGISLEVDLTSAYWEIPDLGNSVGKYPNELIINGGNKSIYMYGGVRPDPTHQTVKYLTGLPVGEYKVNILLSAKSHGRWKYPNILRVQSQSIRIPVEDSWKVINNNQYWFEFSNVIVDSDGFLMVSQYSDMVFGGNLDALVPIVMMEICKI